jgi:hypothetical protein
MKKKKAKAMVIVNLFIWIPLVALVIVGIVAPPFPNDAYGTASGFMSSGVFSMGVLSAGVFSIGVFSAGVFSVGIFSVGIFSMGIISFGTFVIGLWASGRHIHGLFRHQLKDK